MATAFTTGDFIANTVTNSSGEAGPFVPELWSDETIAPYKANLVLAQLVTRMPHTGKKGDTINIPTPGRGAANAKAQESVVTPNVTSNNLTTVSIDKHYEYSVLIEDFADVQAKPSMRKFLTDDAGYALARRIDWDLHLLGRASPSGTPAPGGNVAGAEYSDAKIGSDGTTAWSPTASANAGNAASLADAGIRRLIRTLDDQNVPLMDRAFVIPPSQKEVLLGISRFTEQAFTGEVGGANSIRNGLIGDLYMNPVYVSTNCPYVQDGASSNDQRACLYLHKNAFVFVEQMVIRAQAQYKQEFLSTLLTWDTIYGLKEIRSTSVVPFIVPS